MILLIPGAYGGEIHASRTPVLGEEENLTNQSLNETVQADLFNLPLSFIPNAGQSDPTVLFMVKGSGTSFSFTNRSMLFWVQRSADSVNQSADDTNQSPVTLTQTFPGSNGSVMVFGEDLQPGTANFFIGDDPDTWLSNLSIYGSIRYRDLWPGIDLVYMGNGSVLKREFIVQPGADPGLIRMAYSGMDSLSLDPSGALNITAGPASLIESVPVCYQEINGTRVGVSVQYILSAVDTVTIEPEGYDPAYLLVIDPDLIYSTYLGGSTMDIGQGIAVDTSGNAYITGSTAGSFPITVGSVQTVYGGNSDAFVTKVNPSGSSLLYSTYLGGSNWDSGSGITVDSSGNAYVTGSTAGSFPVTVGSVQTNYGGGYDDVFVTKLNPSGSSLLYSTYLGGITNDVGDCIAVDFSGNAYVTGFTEGSFPVTVGSVQTVFGGGTNDAFVTKVNPSGSSLLYSTYLGGTNLDQGSGIAVDSSGNAYVTGLTEGSFPVTTGSLQTVYGGGGGDAFVTKMNPSGSSHLYSTYLGGTLTDRGYDITVDSSGNAYVTGLTEGSFPVTVGSVQTVYGGSNDAFVTKMNPSGSSLLYSTYLGGITNDIGQGIAVDTSGNAYVTGYTSGSFPVTGGSVQTVYGGGDDAFVTKVNSSGSSLLYSTYLGGSIEDWGMDIAVDSFGNAYISGYTPGSFPVTGGSVQTAFGGSWDAFIAKIFTHPPPGSRVGVFRPSTRQWFLDQSGNGIYGSGDVTYTLGAAGDRPVTGDWNGNGRWEIGVFRPSTRQWFLDWSGNGAFGTGDVTYTLSAAGDKPVTGDWNGNGRTEIGVFRPSIRQWFLDWSGNGAFGTGDVTYTLGAAGDIPVTGEWANIGRTEIGVFRPSTRQWFLDWSGNGAFGTGDVIYTLGSTGDTPVTGDWGNIGRTEIGVYRPSTRQWLLDWSGNGAYGTGDVTYTFGAAGDLPVTGAWSGSPGSASIQSINLTETVKPVPDVRLPGISVPVNAIPKVEMPVKSNPVVSPVTPGGSSGGINPLARGIAPGGLGLGI